MRVIWAIAVLASTFASGWAQDRLEDMSRYDRYVKLAKDIQESVIPGVIRPVWQADSKRFHYTFAGKTYWYDIATNQSTETNDPPPTSKEPTRGRTRAGMPERGRQFSSTISPDGKLKATSRERNVFISRADGKDEFAVTTDGSESTRIKYGVASWVYGEELLAREAMWWSPDNTKLAYYRFDESQVKDYYVTLDEGKIQDRLDTEPYPKAGAPNPSVQLWIYDLIGKKSYRVDTNFQDASLGEYIYDVRWSKDGRYLLFNRTNRHQNVMQFCAGEPGTGQSHVLVEEHQPQSWAENHPDEIFLNDNSRFIWSSERNGFKNYYLYDLDGRQLATLTSDKRDVLRIAKVDEVKGWLFYECTGPSNPYFRQLHRVNLDGTGDKLLTNPELDHETTIAPDGQHFVDVVQSPSHPPESMLVDGNGSVLNTIVKSDTTKFKALGLRETEVFTFVAADGSTKLYGTLQLPSDFDPSKKYPILLSVYGGPESGGMNPRFQTPSAITELGFIVVNLAGRGTVGRGKAFRDAVYKKLGIVEIDDQDAGIRSLASRSYCDLTRVGVYGTSYGGYSTVMMMLRHPETFAVGCASSAVTDWRNYDSVYTERYMGLPDQQDNEAGYTAGSAMTYASKLAGKLMLYFGSADNNVHPSNTYQLTQALESAGKRYDMQVGTDHGHSTMQMTRMWEYFVTNLILKPHPDSLQLVWSRRKRELARARKTS